MRFRPDREDAERGHIVAHHVAKELAHDVGIRGAFAGRMLDFESIIADVRHFEGLAEQATVGMRVCAYAAITFGCQLAQFGQQTAFVIE